MVTRNQLIYNYLLTDLSITVYGKRGILQYGVLLRPAPGALPEDVQRT